MLLIFFFIVLPCFIILCTGIHVLSNIVLKRCIRIELNQRGYKLISVKKAKETFELPKPIPTSFRQYLKVEQGVTVGGAYRRPRQIMLYKEVQFSIPGNETINTLVAAKMFLFIPYKIYFKINLDDLK